MGSIYATFKYLTLKLGINRRNAMNILSIVSALSAFVFVVASGCFVFGRLFGHVFSTGITWTLIVSGLCYIFGYSIDVAVTYPSKKSKEESK